MRKPTDTEIVLRRALFHLYGEPSEHEDSMGMTRAKKALEMTDWMADWFDKHKEEWGMGEQDDLTARLWELAEKFLRNMRFGSTCSLCDGWGHHTEDCFITQLEQLVEERREGN